jgi:uncharacterized protein
MSGFKEISGFDWDEGNWPKCGKHGLSREDIESVFRREFAAYPDPFSGEPRVRAIGVTDKGRYAFIVFVLRKRGEKTYIRPISARPMHAREIIHYERRD